MYRLCTVSDFGSSSIDSQTGLPLVIGNSLNLQNGQKIEIISNDTAFYVLYRKHYKTFSQEDLAKAYSIFLKSWGQYILFIKPNKLPSPIYAINTRFFEAEDQYTGNFRRIDGQFSDSNFNNLDPCETAEPTPALPTQECQSCSSNSLPEA